MARPRDPNSVAGRIRSALAKDATSTNAEIAAEIGCKASRVAQIRRELAGKAPKRTRKAKAEVAAAAAA
jgi:DNA-binding Lrp family transcriptional regulator